MLLQIANRGMDILDTNYWETPQAQNGTILVSVNAGCIRLLLPNQFKKFIPEYKTVDHVVMTHGPWREVVPLAVEFLLEDFTNSPHCYHLSVEAFVSGVPCVPQPGENWIFAIWALVGDQPTKVFEKICYTNKNVHPLPYLKRDDE